MGKVTRKRYAAEFKSRVALKTIHRELRLTELASKHGVHQTMIAQWKRQAIYQKPRMSVPHPRHRKYPYLLQDLVIDRPNQV